MNKHKKECVHFEGGVCHANWEPTKNNPTGFYGEGCELNVKDNCPHYTPVPDTVNPEGHLKPFKLVKPTTGCPECAAEHDPDQPHNQQSLYYQYKFFNDNGRWPTWKDAMSHCSEEIQQLWTESLRERGVNV